MTTSKKKKAANRSVAAPLYNLCRLPNQFLTGTRPPGENLKLALALDLGTRTGYAATYYDPDVPFDIYQQPFFWGQLDLSLGNYDSRGVMGIKLGHYLEHVVPDILFFEDVRHTPANANNRNFMSLIAQAHTTGEFFGALKMVLSIWAQKHNKPVYGVGISDIKRRATNRGNANKVDIITAFNTLFGQTLDTETYEQTGVDNLCDATFALILGLENLGNGVSYVAVETPEGHSGDQECETAGGGRGEQADHPAAGLVDDDSPDGQGPG